MRRIKAEADNKTECVNTGKDLEEMVVRMVRKVLVTEINISKIIDVRIDWHLYYPLCSLLLPTRL